jgi:hypothetical protein
MPAAVVPVGAMTDPEKVGPDIPGTAPSKWAPANPRKVTFAIGLTVTPTSALPMPTVMFELAATTLAPLNKMFGMELDKSGIMAQTPPPRGHEPRRVPA